MQKPSKDINAALSISHGKGYCKPVSQAKVSLSETSGPYGYKANIDKPASFSFSRIPPLRRKKLSRSFIRSGSQLQHPVEPVLPDA